MFDAGYTKKNTELTDSSKLDPLISALFFYRFAGAMAFAIGLLRHSARGETPSNKHDAYQSRQSAERSSASVRITQKKGLESMGKLAFTSDFQTLFQ